MKNTKIFALAMAICIALILTGCSKSDTLGTENPEKLEGAEGIISNVKTATENYNADFELCKSADYVNLDWTNARKCPVYPASALYNIDCEPVAGFAEMPQKEMLDKFKEYCLYYFGECLDEFALFDTLDFERPPEEIVDGVEYRGYYKISDYREKLENDAIKINWLVYRNIEKNQYLWWVYGKYPHWVNRGACVTILDDNIRASSWLPSDMENPIARYYNDGSNDDVKYNLADGEMSIGEAIKYFSEEYPKTLPFENKPAYSVKYVDVYKLAEDTYGYLLWNSKLYSNLPFELCAEMVSDEPVPDYYTIDGQAFMVRKNEIDFTLNCEPVSNEKEIKQIGELILSVLSLKEAADIVSEELTEHIKFNVVSAELLYHGTSDAENIAHLKPTWQFILFNETDLMYYNVYVDAESGQLEYIRYFG